MLIRPAHSGDIAAIEDIVERAYGVYVERIGMRPGPMDDDYAERVDRGLVWVAEHDSAGPGGRRAAGDEAIAGLIALIEAGDHLLIENVAVDPRRQGEGIGRALLDFGEGRARDSGVAELRLYTHEKMSENLALYARRGYVETERRRENGFARIFLSRSVGELGSL